MSEEFVDKYYEMDPETDELVFDGHGLTAGMVVLIENYQRRSDVSVGYDNLKGGYKTEALKWNRWMTVTGKVWINKTEGLVAFIGSYSDGTKRKVILPVDDAWLVKKDSIPEVSEVEKESEVGGCGFHSSEPRPPVEEIVSV